MRLLRPSYKIESPIDPGLLLRIEAAGRTCYKSEEKIGEGSAERFIKMLITKGHESVLEHEKLTVRFICDRGVSHELVRHRIASFSQESTRYCDYNKGHVEFIIPPWTSINPGEYRYGDAILVPKISLADMRWLTFMGLVEKQYKELREAGWKPEQARTVLPNSLKTEIVVTANIREWRLIFRQRTSPAAHPQMRELMVPLLGELAGVYPALFKDILEGVVK